MPRVSIEGSEKEFEVAEDAIIYNALADLGHELPHGCLSGSCGACRIEVKSGADNLAAPSAIEANTIEAIRVEIKADPSMPIRLSCRAKVKGDVTIKPID
jgi:ferredoxin